MGSTEVINRKVFSVGSAILVGNGSNHASGRFGHEYGNECCGGNALDSFRGESSLGDNAYHCYGSGYNQYRCRSYDGCGLNTSRGESYLGSSSGGRYDCGASATNRKVFSSGPSILGMCGFNPASFSATGKFGHDYGNGSCVGNAPYAFRGEPSLENKGYGRYNKYRYESYDGRGLNTSRNESFLGSSSDCGGKAYRYYPSLTTGAGSICRTSRYHPYSRDVASGFQAADSIKSNLDKMQYMQPKVLFQSPFGKKLLCLDIGSNYVTIAVDYSDEPFQESCSSFPCKGKDIDAVAIAEKLEKLVKTYSITGIIIGSCSNECCMPRHLTSGKVGDSYGIVNIVEKWSAIRQFLLQESKKSLRMKDFVERLSSTGKLKKMKYTYWTDCLINYIVQGSEQDKELLHLKETKVAIGILRDYKERCLTHKEFLRETEQ